MIVFAFTRIIVPSNSYISSIPQCCKDTVFITSIVRLWGWPVRIFGSLLSFSPFKIPCKIKTSKTCQITFWMPSSERSLSPSQYIASSIRKASRWISWSWFSISARYPPWLQQNFIILWKCLFLVFIWLPLEQSPSSCGSVRWCNKHLRPSTNPLDILQISEGLWKG